VEVLSKPEQNGQNGQSNSHFLPAAELIHRVELCSNTRITSAEHFQDVRHIVFKFLHAPPSYQAGDVVGIAPINTDDNVNSLLQRLNWKAEDYVQVKAVGGHTGDVPIYFNKPISIFDLCKYYLDIMGTPRRYWFELLSHFAEDEDEKERLQYFGSAEGYLDVYSYCNKEKRSYLETLGDFPGVQIPIDRFVEVVPCIRPRLFSISSSQAVDASQLTITVGIVEFKTPYKRERHGLCTSWLAELPAGTQLTVSLQEGGIRLPDPDVPIVMVGPGTGIAPFRAFLQERCAQENVAENVLFVGTRSKAKDYLYGPEFEQLQAQGKLSLHTAFSRDQPHKVYVQTRISEQAKKIADLIVDGNATVYIAGNAKNMPEDVQEALRSALQAHQDMTEAEAKQYLSVMKRTQRLQLDTWA
jgi:sulfite reductase alpha subunit-like flavoprotein